MVDGDEYVLLAFPIPTWNIPETLTSVERAIASAILHGESNEEIARSRQTSIHTVSNQIARIFSKLAVSSRIDLALQLSSSGGKR